MQDTDAGLSPIRESSLKLKYCVILNFQPLPLQRTLRSIRSGMWTACRYHRENSISAGGGTCAFQLHVNFSHGHVADAVERAMCLAGSFEKSYVLLVRPNADALRNFQVVHNTRHQYKRRTDLGRKINLLVRPLASCKISLVVHWGREDPENHSGFPSQEVAQRRK